MGIRCRDRGDAAVAGDGLLGRIVIALGIAIDLEDCSAEVQDPTVRDAVAGVEALLRDAVEAEAGVGDLDDQHRGTGVGSGIIARGAFDHGDIRLRVATDGEWPLTADIMPARKDLCQGALREAHRREMPGALGGSR